MQYLPMVTNVLRMEVTVKYLDVAIESTIKPEIIATNHITMYGKPDTIPFWMTKKQTNYFQKKYSRFLNSFFPPIVRR